MLAGSQLGDYAAVVGVEERGGDYVREGFAAVADYGGGGLVAGAFDAEDEAVGHSIYLRGWSKGQGLGSGARKKWQRWRG